MNPWFKISDTCYVDLTQIALIQELNYFDIRITLKNGIQENIRTPKFASATIERISLAMKKLYGINLSPIDETEDHCAQEERYNA